MEHCTGDELTKTQSGGLIRRSVFCLMESRIFSPFMHTVLPGLATLSVFSMWCWIPEIRENWSANEKASLADFIYPDKRQPSR
jgi:hypothetical protein